MSDVIGEVAGIRVSSYSAGAKHGRRCVVTVSPVTPALDLQEVRDLIVLLRKWEADEAARRKLPRWQGGGLW